MQLYKRIGRSVCCAHNAYNVNLALRATFGTTTKRSNANEGKDAPEEDVPSPWESGNWKPLEAKPEPEEIKGLEGEIDRSPREGEPPVHKRPIFTGPRFVRSKPKHDISSVKKDAPHSPVDSQKQLEEDDQVYDRRMHLDRLENIRSTAWQNGIRILSGRLHEISVQRAKWINKMSPVMRDRLKEKVFNYMPCNVLPQKTASSPEEPPPWEKGIRKSRSQGIEQLEEELKKFAEWVQPTAKESMARNAVAEATMNLVKNSLKDDVSISTKIQLHGSQQTGLALPWSDIDIQIWDGREAPLPTSHSAPRLLHRLRLVADNMRSSDKWILVTVRDAAYPILNAQHKESGLDVQIVAGSDSHAQQAVVKQCLEDMPYLRTVFYAVRTFFGMRNFNDVFTGGLGSYGIFVLLVATLLRTPVQLIQIGSDQGSRRPHARAFITFFETLAPIPSRAKARSRSINLKKFAISCFPRTKFLKHPPSPVLNRYMALAEKRGDKIRSGQWRMCQRNEWMPYLLTLQDPANPHNDLGRKTYAIKHILGSIATCEKVLQHHITDVNRAYRARKPSERKSMLGVFVGRPDVEYRARREQLERFGLKIAQETGQVWKTDVVGGIEEEEEVNRRRKRNREEAVRGR